MEMVRHLNSIARAVLDMERGWAVGTFGLRERGLCI